jgi:chemotaxis signal transduction protein
LAQSWFCGIANVRGKLHAVSDFAAFLGAQPTPRTGLIAIQPRHHDVAKNDAGLMVGDFGQRIESILGEHHLTAGLNEKNLGAAPYGVAVVDDHDPNAAQSR